MTTSPLPAATTRADGRAEAMAEARAAAAPKEERLELFRAPGYVG
jgi:hypothetical protein